MQLDAAVLSRIQFGFTVGFHILFPTFNIGLAVFIAVMEGLWFKTRNPHLLRIAKFWTKIFALTFGMGVVSGIVLSYELGTNFGRFTEAIGGILGPLFGYEVLTAFFMEAGFLGVMLFGWKRVGPGLHYTATLLVTIGTIISAFWILSANSWMQTPAGYLLEGNQFLPASWWQAIINPSVLVRFSHMMMASFITTSFVIAGISAWYLQRARYLDIAKPCLKYAVISMMICAPLQIVVGDIVGTTIYHHQPLKTAAIEGVWKTEQAAPLLLFALPEQDAQKNKWAIGIPGIASWINTHKFDGTLVGLSSVSRADQPPVAAVFFSFRIMVAIGLLMLAIALWATWALMRRTLFKDRWLLFTLKWATPLGFIATLSGWVTSEMGRQPWIIYGLMRTNDGVAAVAGNKILFSLILFIIVYGGTLGFYLFYLFHYLDKGPSAFNKPHTTLNYLSAATDEKST